MNYTIDFTNKPSTAWKAKGFYEKFGYKIEFFYDGYDDNGKFFFSENSLDDGVDIIFN